MRLLLFHRHTDLVRRIAKASKIPYIQNIIDITQVGLLMPTEILDHMFQKEYASCAKQIIATAGVDAVMKKDSV